VRGPYPERELDIKLAGALGCEPSGDLCGLRTMPFTRPTPGLVPHFDVTVHIVLDDFGKAGRAYRETSEEDTTLGSVVDDLLTGQFNNPVRVVAFNTSKGWSRDVSEDVARKAPGRAPPGRQFAQVRRNVRRRGGSVARRK
jgi:hypothetical protein